MNNIVELAIICIVVFIVTGVLAYVAETILLRRKGAVKREESLLEYYRGIEQKKGNWVVISWALIWVGLMAVSALIIYLAS